VIGWPGRNRHEANELSAQKPVPALSFEAPNFAWAWKINPEVLRQNLHHHWYGTPFKILFRSVFAVPDNSNQETTLPSNIVPDIASKMQGA
jgi:hypothetical protein